MRRPFTDVTGRAVCQRLAPLSGGLEAETTQVGSGLAVAVVLANDGDAHLRLRNPFERVQFTIRGSQGQPLAVPRSPASALIHVSGGAAAWAAADSPIPVVEVRQDDEVAELTALDGAIIVAPAHRTWSVTFLINRIAVREGPGHPSDVEFFAPVVGRYAVGAVLPLIDADHVQTDRIVQTAPIEITLTTGP